MQDEWKHFGKPTQTGEALVKAPLEIGADAPHLAAAYAADHTDEKKKVTGATMRLEEVKGDVAVFDYTLEVMTADLKGVVMKLRGRREISMSTGLVLWDGGDLTLQGGALETGVTFNIRGNGEETTKPL